MKAALVCFAVLVQLGVAAPGWAEEICGNPCEEGYVWTDRNMGMCVPAPPPPEPKTS